MLRLALLSLALLLLIGCASMQSRVIERASASNPHVTRYTPSKGDSMQGALIALEAILTEGHYLVQIVPIADIVAIFGQPAYGINVHDRRTIYLDNAISVNAQFETLAHEAGHIFHGQGLDRPTSQVFAELVGAEVQAFHKSRTTLATSADYLTHFKHAFGAVHFLRHDIREAVEILTGKRPWPVLVTVTP